MTTKVLVVLRYLSFELEEEAYREDVSLAEQFAARDGVQAETIIIRVKLSNTLGEIRRKEAALFYIPMKPEQSGIELISVFSVANFVSQTHKRPILVKVLLDGVLVRLLRVVVQLLFGQATGQLAIRTIEREIESVFEVLVKFVADVAKKPFRVF